MDEETKNIIQKYDDLIKNFATLSSVTFGKEISGPKIASPTYVFVGGNSKIINVEIPLEDITTTESGITKKILQLERRLGELSEQMEKRHNKLSSPDFIAKAPPDVKEKTRKAFEDCRLEHEKVSQELQRLRKMVGESA